MSVYEDMKKQAGGGIVPPAREISLVETRKSFRFQDDVGEPEELDPLPPASPDERMRVADAVAARSNADAPGSPGEAAVVEPPRTIYGPVVIQLSGMRLTLPAAKRWPFDGGHGEILELHSGEGAATMSPESGGRFDILEAGTKTTCLCVGSSPTPTGVFISVIYDEPKQ